MDTKTMINQLKYEAEKHKNDSLFTGQTNITALCSDVIPKLEKLAEYETAEEDGRLLFLPCKVGDTVYLPNKYMKRIVSFNIVEFYIFKDGYAILDNFENEYEIEDFGKTVFLTREEAEKALKEMEGKS